MPAAPGSALTAGVRPRRIRSNAAPAAWFASTASAQVVPGLAKAQAPVQPEKLEPAPGAAVRVMVPGAAAAVTVVVHALPQLMAPPATVPGSRCRSGPRSP